MGRWERLALGGILVVGATSGARAAECYDISQGEPHLLTGTLDYVVFPGPPNFKDVKGGDESEPNYVLRLPAPICLTGDEAADPSKPFQAVEVLESDEIKGRLRALLNAPVALSLRGPIPATTGHHHEPLVAWVTAAERIGAAAEPKVEAQADEPPVAAPGGGVVEASAAATVRGFYEALGRGQGETASLMVAPESRRVAALSAGAMTRFYGGLAQPIRLLDMAPSGANAFLVHYRYGAGSSVCDGKAVVATSERAGAFYIQSIRALDGC